MYLISIVFDISRDINPAEPGFQASPLYVAICLIVPIIIGILAGIISSLVTRFFRGYFNKNESNNR